MVRAEEHIYGYCVGVDLTARDVQHEAKQSRNPWDTAKAFDFSGPVGAITPKEQLLGRIQDKILRLEVNGEQKQRTSISAMIWGVPEIVSAVSMWVTLEAGDLIFTGTPAGVGSIKHGDRIQAECEGLLPCVFTVHCDQAKELCTA